MTITPNALFHADCIEMIQRVETESIDLVYLDPPLRVQSDTPREAGGLVSGAASKAVAQVVLSSR